MVNRRDAPADEAALQRWWDDFESTVATRDWARAEQQLRALESDAAVPRGEVEYARGLVAWERHGPHRAREFLMRSVQTDPNHADARHALALACEELGDTLERRRQFLAVLRLDTADDARHHLESGADRRFIIDVATEVLDSLPLQFRRRLANVPVVLESRPSIRAVEVGVDPRSLGLFEGLTVAEATVVSPLPTRIVLYAANLLAAFGHDDETLEAEIETTIFHEIAHFFGLDEDGVAALGLA
ncbi:MAG: hypothetical protein B7733_17305 [Myxococcales bacterium FL481]|nr:MAG: hypothetical protein B7733_17305 [Myxococcales bacterium FL481]